VPRLCFVIGGEKPNCTGTEFSFVSLTMLCQIKNMFGHYFAHHVGVTGPGQPISGRLNPLPRLLEGATEKI
jgi:hypothetical protein